jgi:hypothetical protein
VSELSFSRFKSRADCRAFESDKGRRTSARVRLDTEKIVQIREVARLECLVGD